MTSAAALPGFLKHLVEAALRGETERLKESVLGVEVFQREAGFDPRTDPIVRVEARRLRSRLWRSHLAPEADPAAEAAAGVAAPAGDEAVAAK